MTGAKSATGTDYCLGMSTINSSSTLLGDLFLMPFFTHDLWTSKMILSRSNNSYTINSTLPIRNNRLFYTPGFLNMSNISLLETQIQQQEVHTVEEYSLLPESSVCVRYPENAFPSYHNLTQVVERTTPLLTRQASVHESLSQKPPENIWDMLVGLLGTEQISNSSKCARKTSASYFDEECDIVEVDACVTSHQASHSQKHLGVNIYSPEISTDVGYKNLIRALESNVQSTTKPSILVEDCSKSIYSSLFHTEIKGDNCAAGCERKKEASSLCDSESLLESSLTALEGRVIVSGNRDTMDCRNNETNILSTFKRVPINKRELQIPTASMQVKTKVQEKSIKPKSSTSMVVKKQQAFQKQRKKLRKRKLPGNMSTEFENKLLMVKSEDVEGMTKEKFEGSLSLHLSFKETDVNEHCIEAIVMSLPKIVESTSLSKITFINLQEEEILMCTDTMMKLSNLLIKSKILHLILMKNQKVVSNYPDTVIIKLDAQLKLSLESGFDLDCNVDSIWGHMASFKQNPHITGLLLLPKDLKLQDALSRNSGVLHTTDSRTIRDIMNSTKPLLKISKSLEVYEDGTSTVCKKSKSLVLQLDFTGLGHNDKFLENQEGLSIDNSTQATEEDSSWSAAIVEEFVPPQEQLKLLLHSSHCQLPKVWLSKYV